MKQPVKKRNISKVALFAGTRGFSQSGKKGTDMGLDLTSFRMLEIKNGDWAIAP